MFIQARFALTATQTFSRTDLATDSERFYTSILELLEDPDEKDEVEQLMGWWNRCVIICILIMKLTIFQTDLSFIYRE